MTTDSSILAWEIPWTEEPGNLQSMGLQRAGHDFVTKQQQKIVETTSFYLENFLLEKCLKNFPVCVIGHMEFIIRLVIRSPRG